MLFYEPNTPQFNLIFWQLSRELGSNALSIYGYVGSYSNDRHCFKHCNWSGNSKFPKYYEVNIIIK